LQAASGNSAMYHALNVCIALVEPLPPTPADQQAAAQAIGLPGGMPPPAVDAAAAEVHAAMRAQATQCIARSIDRLVALLEATDQGRQLPTSYGLLQPPVGLPRLKAVELLAALLHSGDEAAESAVMGTRGVQRSMELFLAFPFNNVLHRHVATLVTAVDKSSPRLAQFLLQDCGLLGWLVDTPTLVMPTPRPGDEHAEKRKPLRAGYVGHLTQISNRLLQLASEGHEQVGHAGWGQRQRGGLMLCPGRLACAGSQCCAPHV
jgi:serine/threonine-protein phosphatase 6 regulatory subunit 3